MKPTLFVLAVVTLVCTLGATSLPAADWITAPSYYTHDKISGQRVAQYTPIGPFYYYQRADFMRSGYRNYRSSIQTGGSADNMHIVEEWGNPVIPYFSSTARVVLLRSKPCFCRCKRPSRDRK